MTALARTTGYAATAVIEDTIAPPAQVDRQVQVGSILRDRFVLLEKISGGSMGVVYKALDRRLAEAGSKETSVAVKVLAPKLAANAQALRALQQEATKGRCLVHPNIVRFIDLDREDNLYFLVMEWLEGHTLADILDSADSPQRLTWRRHFELSVRLVRPSTTHIAAVSCMPTSSRQIS